jgi:hypothetical protein
VKHGSVWWWGHRLPPMNIVWHPLRGLGSVGGQLPNWHRVRSLHSSLCHSLQQPKKSICH